jgi:protein-S-isoprenylcysteine O-methyltransferase Ste14
MITTLLIYYSLVLGLAFAWPTWRLWHHERINALVLPRDDTAEGVIGIWFKALIGAVVILLAAVAVGLSSQLLGELSWLKAAPAEGVGWALLVGSLALITIAQANMGRAWRIGIDHASTPMLAREGLFRWSRNPIFLGLRLNLFGFFLILPNAATLAIWLVGEALLQVQVRLEEAHLAKTFGDAYADYKVAVRRWI